MQSSNQKLKNVIFSSATHRLIIPQFQRHYAWDESQIMDFWNDVSSDTHNFLGPIILNIESEKDGFFEVVDGQQRLITSTIFAALLRNKFKELGDNAKANKVHENYIAFVDEDNNDKGYRLTAGESSKLHLQNLIQEFKIIDENQLFDDIHAKRIFNNYKLLSDQLIKFLTKNNPTQEEKISRLSHLRNNLNELEVIEIKINSDNQAYEIFERINNYGIDLTTSDLLKNHVLKNTIKEKDLSFKKWVELEENILDTNTDLKKFIRYYWLSKEKFVTEKQLYKEIKDKVGDLYAFLDQLLENSEIFQKIKSLNRNDFNEYKTVNERNIGSILFNTIQSNALIGVSQVDVFYLSLIRNLQKGYIIVKPDNVLKVIEDFCFQYFAVCKLPANRVERLFSKYAIELQNSCTGDIKNDKKSQENCFERFKKELLQLKPEKTQFIEGFKQIKYSNTTKSRKLIKYVLGRIENQLAKNNIKSPEKKIDFETVNIEHILPQKPESWQLSRSEIKGYVNLIGNLTLINKGLNSQMGNNPLIDKLRLLSESNIKLNTNVIELIDSFSGKWNEDIINVRSEKLAEYSYNNVWKI